MTAAAAAGKVVIVGGAGFLGTALAARLTALGRPLLVLDTPRRLTRGAALLARVPIAPFAFTDSDPVGFHLDGAAVLVHLTCSSTPASSMASLTRDAAENIAPSVALFEAAGRAGVGRVLFASSGGTVYGDAAAMPIPETAPLEPLSGYGASKVAIETYLQLAARRDGFTGVSMRIGNPYGPYQLLGAPIGVIARYLSEIASGRGLTVWGDGEAVRDYVHIDDTVAAMLRLMDQPDLAGGAYNVGSGTGISLNGVIEAIFAAIGRRAQVRLEPGRAFDVRRVVLDPAKLTRATGWRPEIGLDDGIAGLWQNLQNRAKRA